MSAPVLCAAITRYELETEDEEFQEEVDLGAEGYGVKRGAP